MPGDILDLIDHALDDCAIDDAMRWAPEDSPARPPSGPPVSRQGGGPLPELYDLMLKAVDAIHPRVRHMPGWRWVMNRDWYDRVRAMAYEHSLLGDPEPDPAKRIPAPEDYLLGFFITVTADGGEPHLENPFLAPRVDPG